MEQTPYRYRHDGWTPARQQAFLRALKETGCIAAACRYVRLSRTSAARAYKRMPAFAAAWDLALSYVEPVLVKTAYDRAVHGWQEPVWHLGKIVGHRHRWSDAMLRMLLQREWQGARRPAADGRPGPPPIGGSSRGPQWSPATLMPIEEVEAILMKRFAALKRRQEQEAAQGMGEAGD